MNNGKSNSKNKKSSFSGAKKKDKGKPISKSKFGKTPSSSKSFIADSNKPFDAKPKVKTTKKTIESDEIRLNKYISNSGVCSRREADVYIVSGNVKVNGAVVTEMGYKVKPGDTVVFDGSLITPEKKVYVLLNKPKGFSTINEEFISNENVLSLVKNASKSVLTPVGRMDKSTLGLMLFTNDSDLLQRLNSPEQRSSKVYQVSLDRNLKYEDLEKIKKGIYIEEKRVFVEDIAYVEDQPKTEIGIKLKASNVKLVRALFESLDYNVLKLDRVMYGPITKWNLPRGKWRFLTPEEVLSIKNG
ncbi:pseudouridine synthase [Myroides sp. LJL110]